MAIFSTLRSRRMNNKKAQAVQQVIGFRLDREWFALPILSIHKVIPLGKIYGDPQNTGISLTTYEGKEILVIDVAKQIFNQQTSSEKITTTSISEESKRDFFDLNQQRYLLILEELQAKDSVDSADNQATNLIGLPIDSQPTMYRVESTAFKPLPEAYLVRGNIQCVSSEIVEIPQFPPLFVLDAQKLILSTKIK